MLTHDDSETPDINEQLSAVEDAKAAFMERRDKYLSLREKVETQKAEAERLEDEAAQLGVDLSDSFRDDTLSPEDRRDMALRHTSALSLAARYRDYAGELSKESEQAKIQAQDAAALYVQKWGAAAETHSDAEFEADMTRIEAELIAILKRRAGLYARVPLAMDGKRVGYSEGSGLSRQIYCALKDMSIFVTARFKRKEMDFGGEWRGGAILGSRPDISPFTRAEILGPGKSFERHRKLAGMGES